MAADGRADHASDDCRARCAECLLQLRDTGTLLLDDQFLILGEYMNNLPTDGQPGVGAEFLMWALTNQKHPSRCEITHITKTNSSDVSFVEFPDDPALTGFDPSDRKFIAVAAAACPIPEVWQALDGKWRNFATCLKSHGIVVIFFCSDVR
jgi:hypothetical protein